MGIFTGGDKQWRDAGIMYGAASVESQIAQDRQQRRSFLQDIRQARIAQAYNEWAASSADEYVTASGTAAATGNIFSNFSGAYRYAIDQSRSLQTIQNLQMLGSKLEKRAAQRDKRAATAAQYATAGLQTAGAIAGFVLSGGNPAGAAAGASIGSAIGSAGVRAMGGGRAARRAADKQAISGTMDAWSSYAGKLSLSFGSDEDDEDNQNKMSGVTTTGGIRRSGGYNDTGYAYSTGGTRSRGYNIPGAFSYYRGYN